MENVNKQLLDALKRYLDCDPTSTFGGDTPASQARKAIAAAEQAQQAESDLLRNARQLVKDIEAKQAEPVAAQCRFEGEEEWSPCTLAHHLLVQAHPKEWPHYETRALYAQPPAVAVPDSLRKRCVEILNWQKKGVLEGNELRKYASEQWYAKDHNCLQLAETDTAREVFAMIAAQKGSQ